MTQPIVPPTMDARLQRGNTLVAFISTPTGSDTVSVTSNGGRNVWHQIEMPSPTLRQFDRSLLKVTRWIDKLDHALAASR